MPGAIPDGELAALRREASFAMSDRCQILRPSSTTDEGGESTTYTVLASNVPCAIAPSDMHQADEQVIGGAVQGVALWEIILPALTEVRGPDVVAMGTSFAGAGLSDAAIRASGARIFQVAQVLDPRTLELERAVLAYEIG